MQLNFHNKKVLIISVSVLVAILAAIAAVFIIVSGAKKAAINPLTLSIDSSRPVIPSSSQPESSESVPVVIEDNGIRLLFSSPTTTKFTTTESVLTFTGTSDPAEPLTMNGNAVERGENGIFSFTVNLNIGKNTFSFVHKGETHVYTVTYRYVVINGYDPSRAQTYSSGSTFVVNVLARAGSAVTAKFNGQTINLTTLDKGTETGSPDPASFVNYTGSFKLPDNNLQDLSLGKITYTATFEGKSETFYSGNITCKKTDLVVDYDPNATPAGGKYINVGSGYIAEVIEYNAETFDGIVTNTNTIDDSRPTNNYLPKGTIDYCSTGLITATIGKNTVNYVTLRCGRRVYLTRQDKPYPGEKPVVRQYVGTLPDHNEVGISSIDQSGQHTVLVFDTMWKAPFYFDLLPQAYTNPATQNYTISNVTFNYIDITFCYATLFRGELVIPEDNPLFSSAQVIQNQSDCTVRLYLKKQGAFYGWDSYYNDNSQLCFEFLNPVKILTAENIYGVNLNGAKVMIDVGHGGTDIGAPGFDLKNHNEAIRNLFLANKIKAELESIGAQVFMTRSDDSTSSTDDKIKMMKRIKPDYCIAIHHDSSGSTAPSRFSSFYYAAFSKKAAEYVFNNTVNAGIYKDHKLSWHYYYTGRSTNCPVVLTENGFINNQFDYNNIISEAVNIEKAKAITKGIVEYFKSIQ